MDFWIQKQLRAMVLSDLKEFIPEGYFTKTKEHLALTKDLDKTGQLSYEMSWGHLAGTLGLKLFFEPNDIMSARQVAASDVLMNLGMLVGAEAAKDSAQSAVRYGQKLGVGSSNAGEVARDIEENKIPTLTQNVELALEQYITFLTEQEKAPFLPLLENSKVLKRTKEDNVNDKTAVFVIHGRDGRLRRDFFQFLKAAGLNPMEWSKALQLTGEAAPYIGAILETAFNHAQAIVVLLSPDDEVRLSPELCGEEEKPDEKDYRLQARPNVLFEAGMAFGKCDKRTILVEVGDVKPFSDVAGRHAVRLSNDPEKRNDVLTRLQTAGCDVDKGGGDWLTTGDFNVERKVESNIISPSMPLQVDTEATDDDIQIFILNWWQGHATPPYDVTVNFQEVDRKLGLPKGSTKKHIDVVAEEMEYQALKKGNLVGTYRFMEETNGNSPIY